MVNISEIARVVIDTNIFIYIFKNRLNIENGLNDILGLYKLCTTDGVLEELKRMEKTKWEARASLNLIEKKRIEIIKTNKKGDESLIYASMRENHYVFTNDLNLARKIKERGGNVIILRGRKILDLY